MLKLAWMGALLVMAGGAQDQTVQITPSGYDPAVLEISVGQKVIFHNATSKDHTVTSVPSAEQAGLQEFDSGDIQPCSTWGFRFTRPGTYGYFCRYDRTMSGKIVVGPSK